MTVCFYATFTRYSGSRAEREISGEFQINAKSFDEGYHGAVLAMRAMKEADPGSDWTYDLVALRTNDYSGKRYEGYLSCWENPPSAEKGKAA